jgi:hypothetical protein
MKTFPEPGSEMTFGPFPDEHCFGIENSDSHKAAGEGVKIIEFYKLNFREGKPPQIWLIEAKKTAPRSSPQEVQKFVVEMKKAGAKVPAPAIENLEEHADWLSIHGPRMFPFMPADFVVSDFALYFSELREKMENALRLFFATRIGRHPAQAGHWPGTFHNLPLDTTEVRLFLVIKSAESDWLPPLNDKLRKVMRPVVGTWGLGPSAVEVLTEAMAQQRGLIVNVEA